MKRLLLAVSLSAVISYLLSLTFLLYFPLFILAYLILGGLPWLRILSHTLPRDLFIAYTYVKINIQGEVMAKNNVQLQHIWLDIVNKNINKVAITYGDRKVTFREMNRTINRIARYFVSSGVSPGGAVAKIGIVTALINNNLRGKSLVHSIQVASCKVVVFSPNCVAGVAEIFEEMGSDVTLYSIGPLAEGYASSGALFIHQEELKTNTFS